MAKGYLDFDLAIELYDDMVCQSRVRSPCGEAEAEAKWPFIKQDLELLGLRAVPSQGTRRDRQGRAVDQARAFGRQLYRTVFSGDVGSMLLRNLDEADRQGLGLRIRLRLGVAAELEMVPWEYLYSDDLNRFIAVSTETPIVRYLHTAQRIQPLRIEPPLEILVVVSNPAGTATLDVEEEWDRIKESLADLEESGRVSLTRLARPTLDELQGRLRNEDFHVLHYIGHGGFNDDAGHGVLYLEDESGNEVAVSTETLGTLIHDHRSLRMAVLNSCEGGRGSAVDPFSGLASGLVNQGLAAVVAMQFEITDDAAAKFAHEFYEAIADRYPIDAAVGEGRKSLYTRPGSVEWGTPVLYMRSPDGQIFDRQDTGHESESTTTGGSSGPRTDDGAETDDGSAIEDSEVENDNADSEPDPNEGPESLLRRRLIIAGAALGTVGVVGGAARWLLRDGPPPLTIDWAFTTGGQIFSSPTVVDGLIYVGSNDNRLYAIDAEDGIERWSYSAGADITSSPVVADGVVFVGSNDRFLHAVNAASGAPVWWYETGDVIHSSPTVADGVVYVGSRDRHVHAVDAVRGEEVWRFEGGDWFNSSPTVDDGLLIIGCRDFNIYGLDAVTGDERWRVTTGSTVDSSATISGDTAWIGGDDHVLYAIRRSGTVAWRASADRGIVSTALHHEDSLYYGSGDGRLYAVDATTGREQWRFQTGNDIRSSPMIHDGVVYVGSRDRNLYAVDATTGEEVARFETGAAIDDSSPILANGRVVVGSLDNRLYALTV